MSELVSVVIPTKNRLKKLERAIRSVIEQDYANWELLVVDDKSEEDVHALVKSFRDNRIIYLLNSKSNSNANVCRNIGMENANGEFVAMLDSDDEWLSNHLSDKVEFIKTNNCDGVFGSAYIFDGVNKKEHISRPFIEGERMADYLLGTGSAPTPTHVYKTEFAKEIRWDEGLKRHQDYDFSIRFHAKFKFLPSNVPTVIVHWSKSEQRQEDFDSQLRFIEKHKENMSRITYMKYHVFQYNKLMDRIDVPKNIKEYFFTESMANIDLMTLADYSTLNPPKSTLDKIYNRVLYSIRKMA